MTSILYSFFLILALLLSGCVPAALFSSGIKVGSSSAEERGLGGVISDTALKSTIYYRLIKYSVKLFSKISVNVHQGQVLVTGVVDTPQLKTQAVQIIKSVGGVKDVINEISVSRIELSQIGIDSWVTTQIVSALALDPEIESINYEIKTENGIVYITGIAQHSQELTKVTEKARNIANVKKVISHVKIKNSTTPLATTSPSTILTSTETPPTSFIDDTPVTITEVDGSTNESPLAGLE